MQRQSVLKEPCGSAWSTWSARPVSGVSVARAGVLADGDVPAGGSGEDGRNSIIRFSGTVPAPHTALSCWKYPRESPAAITLRGSGSG
jgi:hypothetical protein